jgi:hypothetical protein
MILRIGFPDVKVENSNDCTGKKYLENLIFDALCSNSSKFDIFPVA